MGKYRYTHHQISVQLYKTNGPMDNNLSSDGCRLYKSNGQWSFIIQNQLSIAQEWFASLPSGRTCPGRAGHVPRGGEASTLCGYNRLKLMVRFCSSSPCNEPHWLVCSNLLLPKKAVHDNNAHTGKPILYWWRGLNVHLELLDGVAHAYKEGCVIL